MRDVHQRICSEMENAELYALGRLEGADLEAFEEHLLICSNCQDMVDFTEEFLTLFREAAKSFEIQPAAVASLEARTME